VPNKEKTRVGEEERDYFVTGARGRELRKGLRIGVNKSAGPKQRKRRGGGVRSPGESGFHRRDGGRLTTKDIMHTAFNTLRKRRKVTILLRKEIRLSFYERNGEQDRS